MDNSVDAGGITWTTDGISQFTRRIQLLIGATPPAIGRGLYKIGSIIMTDAKENYVPVDTGVLRASGHVDQPVIENGEVSVTLGFGGAAEAYAVEQHENLTNRHTTGGPKYLERPVLAHAQEVPDAVGEMMATAAYDASQG